MRRFLAAVGSAGLAVPGWAAPAPTPPTAEALVEKLSAARFGEREAAGHALLKIGADALAMLDRAAAGADPEARERAARLAEQIRKADESARLLAAPPVSFDYAAVPLDAALADLKAKTGIPLTLAPGKVADALRPVTAKAGPLPPWAAVDEFCSAVGLREVFTADALALPAPGTRPVDALNFRRNSSASNYLSDGSQSLPGSGPVMLADGKPDALPGDRSTAVRVCVLPPDFPGNRVVRGAGELVLNLDVAPLAGLRWQEATAVRLSRVEDEAGRPVERSFRPDPPAAPVNAYGEQVFFNGLAGNVVIWDDFGSVRPAVKPAPRVVPVKLRTGDRTVTRLKVLQGVVVGEVSVPNQPLIEVPDLARAVGSTFVGPNDARLTVTGYEAKPGGREVVVRLRVDGPNPAVMQRFGVVRQRVAMTNALPVAPGAGIPLAAGLGQAKFYDAAGNPVRLPTGPLFTDSSDGSGRQTQELELTFTKAAAGGFPVKLAAVGNKGVTVEVPFRLEDVRLP